MFFPYVLPFVYGESYAFPMWAFQEFQGVKSTQWLVRVFEFFHLDSKIGTELINISGQIIATSHDLTPNGGLVREIPLFQGNLGW